MTPYDFLARLVSFDTTSSKSNRACIDFIRDSLASLGVTSEILRNDAGDKACLWATIGQGDQKGIVLAGHTDTVPVEGQDWSTDPFSLTEQDGKLYGRGSCDMKGFIACALACVPDLVKTPLPRPVHLAFTYDEETNMEGAARLSAYMASKNITPEWVWIGEPTTLTLVDQHKGTAEYETRFTGIPGHSGQPDNGLNAIELANSFMDVVRAVGAAKKAAPIQNSRFSPPYSTFNFGMIHGGTASNIIAEHCDLVWQTRVHPGDVAETLKQEIEQKATASFRDKRAIFGPSVGLKTCVICDIPPLMPTADNPAIKALSSLTGATETQAVSFATEAGFFQKCGTHVVVCGPGNIDQAHKANEFIEKSQLDACVDLMRRVLLCSAPIQD